MNNQKHVQVDRRSNLTVAEFRREYLLPGRPVVITDCMKDWDTGLLSFDGLKAHCGDEEVLLYHYDREKEFTPGDVTRRPLGEVIDGIRDADFRTYPYYMRDNWQLADKYTELMDAHSVPGYFFDWFRFLPPALRMPYPRIFIGPKGAVTPLHVDVWGTHAWLSQLEGRKRWLLFSPSDMQYLYDCNVRCEDPDLERHPDYVKATAHEAVIEPGDTIFAPSRWAHWVESLESGLSLTYNYMGPGCFASCLGNTASDVAARLARRMRGNKLAEA